MAETDSLVGIYGAVDRAVQADTAARERVAQLLSPYRNPKVHWYDDFQEWLGGAAGADSAEPAFPEVADALTNLTQTPTDGRTLARRMFAIAVAKLAFPEMRVGETDLRPLAVDALRPTSADDEESGRQEELYRLVAGEDDAIHPDAAGEGDWWGSLIETAADRRLLPDKTGKAGMFPQPCSGQWLTVPGVTGPVAALRTEVETDEVDFDAATRFIEPVNWKTCMPDFWCEMNVVRSGVSLPPSQRRYHEVVSTHCDEKGQAGFWAETELLFEFMWLPDKDNPEAVLTNYQLAAGRPLPNDPIVVDEGSLLVAKVDEGQRPLRITTTKRIKFSYPFMTEAIPLVMCALGYADVAGGLLCCAATRGVDLGDQGAVVTDFPGAPATAVAMDAATRPSAAYAAGSPSGYGQTRPGGLVQDMVDIWARSLRDWAGVLERGAGRAGQGRATNKPDDSGG